MKNKQDKLDRNINIIKTILECPLATIIIILLFGLTVFADSTGNNGILVGILAFLLAVIIDLFVFIIQIQKKNNNKKAGGYIGKYLGFSLLWFFSVLILVDYSQWELRLFFKIIIAFEFIFLACIIPAFLDDAVKYWYKLCRIENEERKVVIIDKDESECVHPNSFFHFIKLIQKDLKGTIVKVDDFHYTITEDKMKLIFQWDIINGILVIYPEEVTKKQVLTFLSKYIIISKDSPYYIYLK